MLVLCYLSTKASSGPGISISEKSDSSSSDWYPWESAHCIKDDNLGVPRAAENGVWNAYPGFVRLNGSRSCRRSCTLGALTSSNWVAAVERTLLREIMDEITSHEHQQVPRGHRWKRHRDRPTQRRAEENREARRLAHSFFVSLQYNCFLLLLLLLRILW